MVRFMSWLPVHAQRNIRYEYFKNRTCYLYKVKYFYQTFDPNPCFYTMHLHKQIDAVLIIKLSYWSQAMWLANILVTALWLVTILVTALWLVIILVTALWLAIILVTALWLVIILVTALWLVIILVTALWLAIILVTALWLVNQGSPQPGGKGGTPFSFQIPPTCTWLKK